MTKWMAAVPLMALAACGTPREDAGNAMEGGGVSLRNLGETDVAGPPPARMTVQGRPIATPSDTRSRYFLLRDRKAVGGTVIAILRQERAGRVAYARTETDCGRRLFHVLGVAPSRALVETEVAYDGPLRSIEGLPLRQELAAAICRSAGTPLAAGRAT